MNRYVCISSLVIIEIVCAGILAGNSLSAEKSARADDPHDKIVYGRYDRKVVPGEIKYPKGFASELKHAELPRPATEEDVAKGKAVFTFEGLGNRRVWKLPESSIGATWVTLKQFPFKYNTGDTGYENYGGVVQAEELQVDGKWKRYFGFVCKNGVAVVPADEVDLSLPKKKEPPGMWSDVRLPGGMGWHCVGPYEVHDGKRVEDTIKGGQPFLVEVYINNRRGASREMPTDFYRDGANGGPAMVKGLSVVISHAPFNARTSRNYYPDNKDLTPLKPIRRTTFAPTAARRTLKCGKWFKAFTIDLSDWFEIRKPGHYTFQFKFDAAAMGLPKEKVGGAGGVINTFTIGTPPKRLSVDEVNEKIPPFGGRFTEKQLRDLITKTVKPSANSQKLSDNKAMANTKPLLSAEKLPAFSSIARHGGNAPPGETKIRGLYNSNWKLISTLGKYKPAALLKELERRMKAEKNRDLKLLLASLAASRGSSDAALFLLESMKTTDYQKVRAVHVALGAVLYALEKDQPDWIVSLVISALADQRYVTNTNYGSNSRLTISYHADEDGNLTNALGNIECRKAVLFLIQMCKDTQGARGPVMALGDIGDRRAIPVLMECLKRAGKTVKYHKGIGLPDRFSRPVHALAVLRAKEAAPELLKYVEFPDVIESLTTLGDSRAIGPLEKLVADGGRITRGGEAIYPDLAKLRLVAAKITLACLDKNNASSKLCVLLSDKSFGEFQRREVVWRLGDLKNPIAIPFLIDAIKTDASGAVVNQAITVLSVFKYKAAVDGLIECFDADFKDKADWKRAYKPEMFRENIAKSLQKITSHKLGPKRQEWVAWWRKNRQVIKDVE